MPTYDYVCASCGHEMEVIHSVHGHGPAACPVCGGQMRKAYRPPAVVFKGTGWARKERSGASRPKGEAKESKDSKDAGSADPKAGKPAAEVAKSGTSGESS